MNFELFLLNGEKINFSRPDFVDSEIVIWGLTSLTDFYKSFQLLFRKQYVSDYQKKILLVQIKHLKFTFNSWQHQKLLIVPNQLQDSTFLFEINSETLASENLHHSQSYCQVCLNLKAHSQVWDNFWQLKALFVLKIFKFLSWLFGDVEKQLD